MIEAGEGEGEGALERIGSRPKERTGKRYTQVNDIHELATPRIHAAIYSKYKVRQICN
jgi:hypothetical protein